MFIMSRLDATPSAVAFRSDLTLGYVWAAWWC